MICEFKMTNFKCFGEKENTISFYAHDGIKRFECNTILTTPKRILKTVGIYGPNNTGKTCLVEALFCLKRLMEGKPIFDVSNAFKKIPLTVFDVIYNINGKTYHYNVYYDSKEKRYIRETLSIVTYAQSNPAVKNEELIITRSGGVINSKFIKVLLDSYKEVSKDFDIEELDNPNKGEQ